ncbi:MAG: hypothetical protein EBU96_08250 [Actinobacteria bacterium]|nr:hypothetical protein [Actinomycetota bacterium]
MPNKVFSKGDMMENLPQKTSMGGGGMADSYRGPSGGQHWERDLRSNLRNLESEYKESFSSGLKNSIRNVSDNDKSIGPALRAGVVAGATAAAGAAVRKAYKDRKDTEQAIEYRKKPKMADKPPKISPRKAYEE